PLERQSAAQYNKTWHTVQVQAPYREIRELTSRVEQDKGLIEALHLEAQPARADQPTTPGRRASADEVQARFRMTALELTPQAKVIIDRALAAGGEQPPASSPLALNVPGAATPRAPSGRDPFAFLSLPAPPAPPRPPTGAGGPEAPPPPPL